MLLLDEHEARLDAVGRSLLERLLAAFDGATVAVSHDRYLLDETVSQIAELDRGRIRVLAGQLLRVHARPRARAAAQQPQYVTQQKEIERLEAAIRRFKDWAHRVVDERHIKQARNKQRQIDRMEKVSGRCSSGARSRCASTRTCAAVQRVFELRHVGMQFGDDVVLADVELTVVHGERVGFVGANGAGRACAEDRRRRARADRGRTVWIGASDPDGLPRPGSGDARPRVQSARHGPPTRTAARKARPSRC